MSLQSLETLILKSLVSKPLRFRDLREQVYPKFKAQQKTRFDYSIESFATILTRKLKKLLKKDFINRIDQGHQNVCYSLTEEGKRKIRDMEIVPLLSEIDDKWFEPLRNMILQIKEDKSPENFLDNWCFTFIGNIPIGFSKDIQSMQRQLLYEKNLGERRRREIEKLREEFENANSNIPINKWAEEFSKRVEEDIGWSNGEYFNRLVKKAEGEKDFAQRFKTIFGITDEMIEELQKRRKNK